MTKRVVGLGGGTLIANRLRRQLARDLRGDELLPEPDRLTTRAVWRSAAGCNPGGMIAMPAGHEGGP